MELKTTLGIGHQTSGCRGCGEVFTSLTGFDRHRRGFRCLHPAETGLRQRPDGKWSMPAQGLVMRGPAYRGV
jgi:hypothetical protein